MAKKSKKSKKYYYIFIAIVLIVVLTVTFLDYKFRFGIVDWEQIFPTEKEGGKATIKNVRVDEIGNLTVKFIDIGQGDAILITFPDGANMLIDAGDRQNDVKRVLDKNLTVDGKKLYLDYVVLTHSDADHVGSMPYVYENYQVGYTFRPYTKSTAEKYTFSNSFNLGFSNQSSAIYNEFLNSVKNEKCDWEYFTDNSDFTYVYETPTKNCELKIDFLMPYIQSVDDYQMFGNDVNEISSIIMIEYAGVKMLFTGDIDSARERALKNLEQHDVLKVAHHGSKHSSSLKFLEQVQPKIAVISVGAGNSYGHPHPETLQRLESVGSNVLSTDELGAIKLTFDDDGIKWYSYVYHKNDF
jgi:competence protein ComEC